MTLPHFSYSVVLLVPDVDLLLSKTMEGSVVDLFHVRMVCSQFVTSMVSYFNLKHVDFKFIYGF